VIQDLLRFGFRFELNQALRLIHKAFPSRRAIGQFGSPSREPVRLYGVHDLSSPSGSVAEIRDAPPGANGNTSPVPMHLMTPSGLTDGYNPCSLPLPYIAQVRSSRDKNPALPAFLDLFNHRLLSLEYRAWEKSRFHVRFERTPTQALETLSLSRWLYSLVGSGIEPLLGRLQMDDRVFLQYVAAFLSRSRPASPLAVILARTLGLNVWIEEFHGRWCMVHPTDQARLTGGGQRLGDGPILGASHWYQQASIRICLGPVTLQQFLDLLPGTPRFSLLVEIATHYTRRAFDDFEISLSISEAEIPPCSLTQSAQLRLGWTSWLRGTRGAQTRTVVFRSNEEAAVARRQIVDALRESRQFFSTTKLIAVDWAEEVVQHCVRQCRRATVKEAPEVVRRIVHAPLESFSAMHANAKTARLTVLGQNLVVEEGT